MGVERSRAVGLLEDVVKTVSEDVMPVPVRDVWVYGDVALGRDPVRRINVYLTKELLLKDDPGNESSEEDFGVKGVGSSVRTKWAEQFPELIRANHAGYAAPAECLAAHLFPTADPFHLEVCNTSFPDNVQQRAAGAVAREMYEEIIDPRGVCLWMEGSKSPTAFEKLRDGSFVFPKLQEALTMIGLSPSEAEEAVSALETEREERTGITVRSDVL